MVEVYEKDCVGRTNVGRLCKMLNAGERVWSKKPDMGGNFLVVPVQLWINSATSYEGTVVDVERNNGTMQHFLWICL